MLMNHSHFQFKGIEKFLKNIWCAVIFTVIVMLMLKSLFMWYFHRIDQHCIKERKMVAGGEKLIASGPPGLHRMLFPLFLLLKCFHQSALQMSCKDLDFTKTEINASVAFHIYIWKRIQYIPDENVCLPICMQK